MAENEEKIEASTSSAEPEKIEETEPEDRRLDEDIIKKLDDYRREDDERWQQMERKLTEIAESVKRPEPEPEAEQPPQEEASTSSAEEVTTLVVTEPPPSPPRRLRGWW